jgi:hypothetical protein
MRTHARVTLLLTLSLLWTGTYDVSDSQDSLDEQLKILGSHGIASDTESILIFLRRLQPSAKLQRETDELIKQLSSTDFSDREAATKKLGTLGFVNAAFELAEQCGDVVPDVIYVACGTMGTVAGLALGLRLAGLKTRINAVSVVPQSLATANGIVQLFVAANRKLHEINPTIPLLDDPLVNLTLRDEFFGNGYAEATSECTQAVALIRNTEDIALETTYTGKALAALIHDARCERLAGQRIVFWNTYNARPYPPAVNAAQETSLPDWARHYLSTDTEAR